MTTQRTRLEGKVEGLDACEVVAIDVQPEAGPGVLQGDALLTVGPDGTKILLDAGYPEHAGKYVLPYLAERGITSLDYIAFTEPSTDHIGGLTPLIESGEVAIGGLLEPDIDWWRWDANNPVWVAMVRPQYDELLAAAAVAGIPVQKVYAGSTFQLGSGATWKVLHGWENTNDDHNAVVVKVSYAGRSMLLTGDATGSLWPWLQANADITCDVLKLPHHCDNGTGVGIYLDQMGPPEAMVATAPERIVAETKCGEMYKSGMVRGIKLYSNGVDGVVRTLLTTAGVLIATSR